MRRLGHVTTMLGLVLGVALLAAAPAAADSVGDTITVASPAAGIATSPDGTQVYVAAYDAGGLSVVDTTTGKTLDLPGVTAPHDVVVSLDGTRAYVTDSTLKGVVAVMDTTTGSVVAEVHAGAFPQALAMTPGGDQVWAANFGLGQADSTVTVIATKTNKVKTNVPVGKHPTALAFAPDGTHAYVTDADLADDATGTVAVIDTKSFRTTATVEVGRWPTAVAVSPDDRRVYVTVADTGSLVVIDTESRTVTDTVEVGSWPTDVALTPDGTRAYVTNAESGTVSVVDTTALTVTDTLDVPRPQAVVLAADATRAWVTSRTSNQVTELELDKAPTFVTSVLQSGQVTQPYEVQVHLAGADPTFEVTNGRLPAGLTLDAATGQIAGIPTMVGQSTFTLTATAIVSGIRTTVSADYEIRVDPVPAAVDQPEATTDQTTDKTQIIVWTGALALLAASSLFIVCRRV